MPVCIERWMDGWIDACIYDMICMCVYVVLYEVYTPLHARIHMMFFASLPVFTLLWH